MDKYYQRLEETEFKCKTERCSEECWNGQCCILHFEEKLKSKFLDHWLIFSTNSRA